ERDLATHDPPATQEVVLRAVQVHGAALPPGTAVHTAVQLRHDRARGDPLGQRLYVLAVRPDHVVFRPEHADRAHPDGLLPDIEMAEPADLPERVRLSALLLEPAAEQHHVQELVMLLAAQPSQLPAFAGGFLYTDPVAGRLCVCHFSRPVTGPLASPDTRRSLHARPEDPPDSLCSPARGPARLDLHELDPRRGRDHLRGRGNV